MARALNRGWTLARALGARKVKSKTEPAKLKAKPNAVLTSSCSAQDCSRALSSEISLTRNDILVSCCVSMQGLSV